ncbi:hypothetical protein BDF21DRAFT_396309 [Thamnidium elegans]|nr:hypothetical protein BDF21DRAFT_396309 [Thamnidium elegans]
MFVISRAIELQNAELYILLILQTLHLLQGLQIAIFTTKIVLNIFHYKAMVFQFFPDCIRLIVFAKGIRKLNSPFAASSSEENMIAARNFCPLLLLFQTEPIKLQASSFSNLYKHSLIPTKAETTAPAGNEAVYNPPYLVSGLLLLVMITWYFTAVTLSYMTLLPVIIGRIVLKELMVIETEINDIYSFILGISTLLHICRSIAVVYKTLCDIWSRLTWI